MSQEPDRKRKALEAVAYPEAFASMLAQAEGASGTIDFRGCWWTQTRVPGSGYLPLLPRHKILLVAPDGGGERFVLLFRRTWERIPLWARRQMLHYWRTPAPEVVARLGGLTPCIELADSWDGRGRGDLGAWTKFGYHVRYWRNAVEAMSDDVAQDLIIHELIHILQRINSPELFECRDKSMLETAADEIAEEWGFGASSIEEWGLSQGFIKVRTDDPKKLSPSQRKRMKARERRSGRGFGVSL